MVLEIVNQGFLWFRAIVSRGLGLRFGFFWFGGLGFFTGLDSGLQAFELGWGGAGGLGMGAKFRFEASPSLSKTFWARASQFVVVVPRRL